MRVIFAGTPGFAATILEGLLNDGGSQVVCVLTQPDRPAGRGRRVAAGAVKRLAERHAIRVEQPSSLRDPRIQETIAGLEADVMVVAAYGALLPPAVLDIPPLGCINVHASLLPRWRGAAPVQHAILAGDAETGVSIMRMDAGLDTGPVLLRAACAIRDDDTAGTLEARLADLGARAIVDILPRVRAGSATATPQDQALATYAPRIEKSAGWIDWRQPARDLERRVRAYDPWPVACTLLPAALARDDAGRRLRIWRSRVTPSPAREPPGTVLASGAEGIDVATGADALRIVELQAAGARRVTAGDYLNARPVPAGTRFTGPGDDD